MYFDFGPLKSKIKNASLRLTTYYLKQNFLKITSQTRIIKIEHQTFST